MADLSGITEITDPYLKISTANSAPFSRNSQRRAA